MLTFVGRSLARRLLVAAPARAPAGLAAVRRFSRSAAVRVGPAAAVAAPSSASTRVKRSAASTTSTKKSSKRTAKKAASKKKKKTTTTRATKKKTKLTPEAKEKVQLRDLKKMALLKGPQLLPDNSWSVFLANNMPQGSAKLGDKVKQAASQFSRLSTSEVQRLQSIAQSHQQSNREARQQWMRSYPPEAIYIANVARRRLARKLSKSRVYLLHDDRLPKRAPTPYILFIKSHFSSANRGGSAPDAIRDMARQWRSMSESEKRPFKDRAASESQRTAEQLKTLKAKAKTYWKDKKYLVPS